jgi:hypothetical protein
MTSDELQLAAHGGAASVRVTTLCGCFHDSVSWQLSSEAHATRAVVDPAMLKKQEEEAAERARAAQRAQGTPVTVESFKKWQAEFEAEQRAVEAAAGTAARTEGTEAEAMTGKAWFLEKYRGDDGDSVEALEEELAELDVDDEEDEESVAGEADGGHSDEDDDEDFLDQLEDQLEADA